MIGHDIVAALPGLRAQAESLMVDTCTIERLTSAWDEAQQRTVTSWTAVHSNVPCALDDPDAPGRMLVTDEASTPINPLVKIPVTYTGVEPDDRVTLASGPVVYVTDAPVRTHQVQRRLRCRWVK